MAVGHPPGYSPRLGFGPSRIKPLTGLRGDLRFQTPPQGFGPPPPRHFGPPSPPRRLEGRRLRFDFEDFDEGLQEAEHRQRPSRFPRGRHPGEPGPRPPPQPRGSNPRPQARGGLADYSIVQPLEPGGMSESINVVSSRTTGKLYVSKRVSNSGIHRPEARAELAALLRFGRASPHLNGMREHVFSPDGRSLTLVLEYCDRGTLSNELDRRLQGGGGFAEVELWHVFDGVAKGLAYMHDGVLDATHREAAPVRGWERSWHLDMKLDNIFLSSPSPGARFPRVVIGDFGCVITAREAEAGRQVENGAEAWGPAEQWERFGWETDVWAMGAVVHCLGMGSKVPDRRRLEGMEPVGRGGGRRMNASVRECCGRDWRGPPTARMVVRAIAGVGR